MRADPWGTGPRTGRKRIIGIGLLAQDMARQLEAVDYERADDMAEVTNHVKEADQYARDLSHGLIPADVEANGLTRSPATPLPECRAYIRHRMLIPRN